MSSRSSFPPSSRSFSLRSAPLILLVLVVGSLACDRNIEPYQPGEEPRAPDLARIFPAPAISEPQGDSVPSAGGGTSRGALPPARAEAGGTMGGDAVNSQTAAITGEISLAPELAMARPDGAVLFVIARSAGVEAGPPLAVLRIPNPDFPLDFSIGPEDVMIPSMQFVGAISLSARLDADGNAMTRTPGDIASPRLDGLSPGDSSVRLVLSERS
jgi:hypothetical protein